MSEPRGFVRPGRRRPNRVYLVTGDGSTPESDPEVAVAFTDAWGVRVATALNLLEEQERAQATGTNDPREQLRRERDRVAMASASAATRSIACQSLDPRRHTHCIGLQSPMNDGLGCLCPCHDGQAHADDEADGPDTREGVVA